MYHIGMSKEDIVKTFGNTTKEGTVANYIKLFEEGKKQSESHYVGKKNSDNELISAMGSLFKYLPKSKEKSV